MNFFKNTKTEKKSKPGTKPFRLFPSSKGSLLIISMDEGWLKCVHVKGNPRKRKIEFLCAEPIKDWDEGQIVERLKALLQEQKLDCAHFLISHPSHLTRARALRLPSINPVELKTMVDLQVEKHTPDAKEETLTYFRTMDSDAQGYSNVFLVMAHQDAVARSARIVQKLPGRLTEVGSDVEGLTRWYQKYLQSEKSKPEAAPGTLLIDMDTEYASLMIFYGTEAYYHRSIPLKVASLIEDASGDALNQFLGEVHRSIMAYEEEGFKGACTRFILTGVAVKIPGLAQKIGNEIKMQAENIPAEKQYHLNEFSVQYLATGFQVSFTSLLGFLPGEVSGDLTPAAMRIRQTFAEKVKIASVLGSQVLFGLILVSCFFLYRINQDLAYESLLKSLVKQIEKPASDLEISLEHLRIVKDRLNRRGVLLESLVAVKLSTAPDIQWNDLTYIEGESLSIKGVSGQMTKVFEMVTALEKLPIFVKPEARRVTKRKVDNKDVTDFELVMPFPEAE